MRKKRSPAGKFFLIASTFILTFCFFLPASFAVEDCRSLIKNKCIRCHFETRICDKIRKGKGKGSWKRTIKSMIRHGTILTKEEQKQLVSCLSRPDPAVLNICDLEK